MKSLIVFVLSLISLASCQETFNYGPPNGTVCIRATFEAQFDLTFTDSNGTHEASFSLPDIKDIEVDGNCPEDNIASLNLTFTMQETSLVFTITNDNGQISGDIQFVLLDPSVTFPSVNYSSPVSLTGLDQEFSQMGQANNSYMCHAEENFTLSSSNQSDISASANISFMNLQFQAFDLPKENFSAPFECSEDHHSSTTMSTTILTTTLPTPTGVGEYVVKNGTEVCLRMKANITISVTYENKNGTMVTHEVMIPENADVNGTCGDSEITMNFILKPEGEFEYEFEDKEFGGGELTFVFVKDKGFSFIQECNFELNFNDTNRTISEHQTTNDVLALSSKPYTCNTETLKVEMDEVVLRNLTVQAFDLSDGNFSKNAMDCHQLPPETPPSQNYTVSEGNTTCISMSVALALKITYETTESKNETKTVNIEKDEPSQGRCSGGGNMEEYITILYKKDQFSISFQFVKDKSVSGSLGADAFNYYVESINVTHTLDEDIFTNAKNPGAKFQAQLLKQKLYETSSDKYYKCSTESTFKIDDSVSVVTKDMRLVAFNTDTKQPNLFGDNANECTADTETNSVVPIAVGAALAGLVVIVLIAYLIGRRRNHKGYESV